MGKQRVEYTERDKSEGGFLAVDGIPCKAKVTPVLSLLQLQS